MRRNAVLITLLASQVAVTALAALLYFGVRASVLAAFQEYGATMPAGARVALSGAFLPGAVGAAWLLALPALLAPLKRSKRHGLLGAGVVIASAAFVLAAWAAFASIFQPA